MKKADIMYTMGAASQRTRSVMVEGGSVTQGVRGDGGDAETIQIFLITDVILQNISCLFYPTTYINVRRVSYI